VTKLVLFASEASTPTITRFFQSKHRVGACTERRFISDASAMKILDDQTHCVVKERFRNKDALKEIVSCCIEVVTLFGGIL